VVLICTALWTIALVVLLLLGDRVDRVWVWTCVAGIVLAVLGLALMWWQGQTGPRSQTPQSERTSNSEVS
jgi:protein-S-isoprenylcysteine O-methyltransferase Ste14